jgi:hypothetical protein
LQQQQWNEQGKEEDCVKDGETWWKRTLNGTGIRNRPAVVRGREGGVEEDFVCSECAQRIIVFEEEENTVRIGR